MANQWVVNWLVIDYRRWSMSNWWLIDDKKFCGPSITQTSLITHQCEWLCIDATVITHWLHIDYSYFIMLHNFYSLLQISSMCLYYNYLSLHKSSSWTVPDENNWQRRVVNTGQNPMTISNQCNQWLIDVWKFCGQLISHCLLIDHWHPERSYSNLQLVWHFW